MMATPQLHPVYDPLLDFIYERVTTEDILRFELPETIRQRAIDLLERQDDDTLTAEEADELEQMHQMNRMVSALKTRALVSGTSRYA
jgi:hypothetical protein